MQIFGGFLTRLRTARIKRQTARIKRQTEAVKAEREAIHAKRVGGRSFIKAVEPPTISAPAERSIDDYIDTVDALRKSGMVTAEDVSAANYGRFVKRMAENGTISEEEAEEAFHQYLDSDRTERSERWHMLRSEYPEEYDEIVGGTP